MSVPVHYTPQWSKRLNYRTAGLFKKATQLSELEDVQITILVSSNVHCYSFLGHGTDNWRDLHQLVSTHSDQVAVPDDFLTVSQLNAKRSQSIPSAASSSIAVKDAASDLLSQRLTMLEEQLKAITGAKVLSNARKSNPSSSPVSEQSEAATQQWSPWASETTTEQRETTPPTAATSGVLTDICAGPVVDAQPTRTVLSPSSSAPGALQYHSEQAFPRVLSAKEDRVQKRDVPRRRLLPEN